MGFFNVFKREVPTSQTTTTSSTDSGGASYSERIQHVGNEKNALAVAAYYRAVSLISGSVSMIPINYLIFNKIQGRFAHPNDVRSNTLYKLWNVRPNRFMNAVEMKRRAAIKVMNKGYAVFWIVRDKEGEAEALYLIDKATYNTVSNNWNLYDYLQKINLNGVPDSDVIVWNNTFVGDNGLGISTISYARQVLTQSATLTNEAINRAATGGRTKAIISNNNPTSAGIPTGKYAKKQLEQAKSDLQKQIDAGYDVYEIAGDVKVSNLSLSAADLQFIESQKMNVSDIARFTDVPLSLLMESTNQNYKSGESSDLQFYTHCLAPRMSSLVCEITCKMIISSQLATQKFEYDHSILHHMDLKTSGEYEKMLLETGQVSPNDLRRTKNMAPIEGGDAYYVSTNLAVVNSPKLTE